MSHTVAVITGGTKGIGLGIAKIFLKSGYKLALIYRADEKNAAQVIQELDSENVQAIKADITQNKEREEAFDQVESVFGSASVLVNNAGMIGMGRLLDVKEEVFRSVLECNFFAPIFLSQLFARRLIAKGMPGSIVNILSIGAHRSGNLAYCASKAALLSATKSMAHELAKHQIRVNSVSPFGVETELNLRNREENPEAWNKLIEKSFLKRASTPEEIGRAVLYLASENASFVTGVDLPVNGGYLAR